MYTELHILQKKNQARQFHDIDMMTNELRGRGEEDTRERGEKRERVCVCGGGGGGSD